MYGQKTLPNGSSAIAVGRRSLPRLIPQFFEFSRKLVEFDAPAALDRKFLKIRCWQTQGLYPSWRWVSDECIEVADCLTAVSIEAPVSALSPPSLPERTPAQSLRQAARRGTGDAI